MEEILSIWGIFHAAGFSNIRYYLNPFTLKLEPLMSDQDRFQLISNELKNSLKKNQMVS